MKHPRMCKECKFWVTLPEDDGYCRRPDPRTPTGELPPDEENEPPENGELKED